VAGDQAVLIAEYWTLDTLFPPAQATTDPATTGHAIVASTSGLASGRRTELLLPSLTGVGTNLAASATFFIFNNAWRRQGQAINSQFGGQVLYPDTLFTIRHPLAVTSPTTFRCVGDVELRNFTIPLRSRTDGRQDNFVALIRPVNVALDDLNLAGSNAFISSTSAIASGRRDELLVFNNAAALRNKAASATYFHFNGAWRKQGQAATLDFGRDEIPAGAGFLIRKFQTTTGETVFWTNQPGF
jgi:uncharacterized protein (TIGR02597 family)